MRFHACLVYVHLSGNKAVFSEDCMHVMHLPATYVTGSAKTGHNHTSLNLQYEVSKTLGAYWYIVEKIP